MRYVGLAATILALALTNSLHSQERSFQFGLMGDTAYTERGVNEFENLIAAVNKEDLAFVVHIGDFEADGRGWTRNPDGPMPCTPESHERVFQQFQTVRHPLILTPGDNDWTDCASVGSAKFDTLQLLSSIRTKFFPEGRSLGQRQMPVESQSKTPQFSKFKENLTWTTGGILFVTLHIVGSNDNLSSDPAMAAEQAERKAANIAWIKDAFSKARNESIRGVVFLTQANPGFENYWPENKKEAYFRLLQGVKPAPVKPDFAFTDYVSVMVDEMEGFRKPVAYLHGDTHLFRIDKPLYSKKKGRAFENFTRVETFGAPDSHWVRVRVDTNDPQVFTFRGEIIDANTAN